MRIYLDSLCWCDVFYVSNSTCDSAENVLDCVQVFVAQMRQRLDLINHLSLYNET